MAFSIYGDDPPRKPGRVPARPLELLDPIALGSEYFPRARFQAVTGTGGNPLEDLIRGGENTTPVFYNPITAPQLEYDRSASAALQDAISELSGARQEAARGEADLRRESARRASQNILFSLAPQVFAAVTGAPVELSPEQRQLAQEMVRQAFEAESAAKQVGALAPAEAAIQQAQIAREDAAQQLGIDQTNAQMSFQAQLQNNAQLQNVAQTVAQARRHQQQMMVQLGTWSADRQMQADKWLQEFAENQYQFDVTANLRAQQIQATLQRGSLNPTLKSYKEASEKFVTSYNKVLNYLGQIYGSVEMEEGSAGFLKEVFTAGYARGPQVPNIDSETLRSIAANQEGYKRAIDDLQESLGLLRGYGLDSAFDPQIIQNAGAAASALSTATRFGERTEGIDKNHVLSGYGAYQTIIQAGDAKMPPLLGGLNAEAEETQEEETNTTTDNPWDF